jgi:hypothetical protein
MRGNISDMESKVNAMAWDKGDRSLEKLLF